MSPYKAPEQIRRASVVPIRPDMPGMACAGNDVSLIRSRDVLTAQTLKLRELQLARVESQYRDLCEAVLDHSTSPKLSRIAHRALKSLEARR